MIMAEPNLSTNTTDATEMPMSQEQTRQNYTISDLKGAGISPTLWYRFHVLLFDLEHFQNRPQSRQRLENVNGVSFIGKPYFNSSESCAIKSTLIGTKTLSDTIEESLQERLQRRMKKRVESGDYRVCTAHDIAPILATALGINLKELGKDERFTEFVQKNGLRCGEEWKGLKVKSFAPKQKRKKR